MKLETVLDLASENAIPAARAYNASIACVVSSSCCSILLLKTGPWCYQTANRGSVGLFDSQIVQARSQPARWGGSELGWVEHQAHPPPPLGHCPRDVINLKNAPTLGHSQAPPPGHCPCDVIHIFQGWNKIAKGWNKIAEGWNKIAERWNKIAKGWNKIAERWNKIAKGWNKIFGMGNWGGCPTPPPPWLRACSPTPHTTLNSTESHLFFCPAVYVQYTGP